MTIATPLLAEDGSTSMATMFLTSHHAFRRDIARFARALQGPVSNAADLAGEWTFFHAALHGHHEMEDSTIFPDMAEKNPHLRAPLLDLGKDHKLIDPLLARGDDAFAHLEHGTGPA